MDKTLEELAQEVLKEVALLKERLIASGFLKPEPDRVDPTADEPTKPAC